MTAAVTQHAQVLVVGGGQAGLTAGYHLRQAEIPFLILEAAPRIGDSWRRRWESLELFTVADYSALPGLRFPGDAERFPGKDEVADYLESYAGAFELPVRLNAAATSLARRDGGYRVVATDGTGYDADQVIVATGAYQRPFTPALAGKLDDAVLQLHSADYRDPEQLPAGNVLVVGGGNSGVQIAQELSATRRVQLAVGSKPPRLPRRILGKSLHWWGDHLGLIRAPIARLRGPKAGGDLLVGTSHRQLRRRHGVDLLGRATDAHGRTVRCADGASVDVAVVIWATGFRPDYSWIQVPVLDDRGEPIHRRGVTRSEGLYFLGMHLQHSLGSSLIGFVRHDAAFIVDRVRRTLAR